MDSSRSGEQRAETWRSGESGFRSGLLVWFGNHEVVRGLLLFAVSSHVLFFIASSSGFFVFVGAF